MSYQIEWRGEPRSDLEPKLKDELDGICDGDVTCIITHTMMVDGDFGSNGPSVHAYWDEDRQALVAEYVPETSWTSLDEL